MSALIRIHAARTDRWISEHMRKGDADIDAEAVRRCLMPCPEMMRKRSEQKKTFVVRSFREDWYK